MRTQGLAAMHGHGGQCLQAHDHPRAAGLFGLGLAYGGITQLLSFLHIAHFQGVHH
jgi:hypothetical protein